MGLSKGIRVLLTIKSKIGLSRGIRAPLTIRSRMGLNKGIRALLTIKSKIGLNKNIRALLTIRSRTGLSGGIAWAAIEEASVTVFGWGIYKKIDLKVSSVFLKETNPILKC